jgi:hypothetical protein
MFGVSIAVLGKRRRRRIGGHALVWFLLNHRIKHLTYRSLDRSNSRAKANVKAVDDTKSHRECANAQTK